LIQIKSGALASPARRPNPRFREVVPDLLVDQLAAGDGEPVDEADPLERRTGAVII